MGKAAYSAKHNLREFANSESELEAKIAEISKQNPNLVFVWPSGIQALYIEGYANRSAIPFDSYESHLRDTKHYLQNGERVQPTPAQLARIERAAFTRD